MERIELLERTVATLNRRVRWLTIALAVAVAGCLMGQNFGVPDVITCHGLRVIDGNGAVAATINTSSNNGTPGNQLCLYSPTIVNANDANIPTVMLMAWPQLAAVDARMGTKERVSSFVTDDGACCSLDTGTEGESKRLVLSSMEKGPAIRCSGTWLWPKQ